MNEPFVVGSRYRRLDPGGGGIWETGDTAVCIGYEPGNDPDYGMLIRDRDGRTLAGKADYFEPIGFFTGISLEEKKEPAPKYIDIKIGRRGDV